MSEFETTVEEDRDSVIEHCVVFDPSDGRVVHVHQFIGDGSGLFGPDGQAERERIAMERVRARGPVERLEALHLPSGFRPDREVLYKVDVKARALQPAGKVADLIARKRARSR